MYIVKNLGLKRPGIDLGKTFYNCICYAHAYIWIYFYDYTIDWKCNSKVICNLNLDCEMGILCSELTTMCYSVKKW